MSENHYIRAKRDIRKIRKYPEIQTKTDHLEKNRTSENLRGTEDSQKLMKTDKTGHSKRDGITWKFWKTMISGKWSIRSPGRTFLVILMRHLHLSEVCGRLPPDREIDFVRAGEAKLRGCERGVSLPLGFRVANFRAPAPPAPPYAVWVSLFSTLQFF